MAPSSIVPPAVAAGVGAVVDHPGLAIVRRQPAEKSSGIFCRLSVHEVENLHYKVI
jgi:hypothetical protein